MTNESSKRQLPDGWREILAESKAQLAAGQTVPSAVVRQHLLDAIARLKRKKATK